MLLIFDVKFYQKKNLLKGSLKSRITLFHDLFECGKYCKGLDFAMKLTITGGFSFSLLRLDCVKLKISPRLSLSDYVINEVRSS